jgi:hypothetical protein
VRLVERAEQQTRAKIRHKLGLAKQVGVGRQDLRFLARPCLLCLFGRRHVVVAVCFCVCALTLSVFPRAQVLLMDSERLPGANMELARVRMVGAIKRVRQMEVFRKVPVVVAAEAAPGPVAATFKYQLIQEKKKSNSGLEPLLLMHEYGADRKPGVPKTKESTELMVRYFSELMRDHRLVYSANLLGGINTQPQAMIDKLQKQMSEYRCEVKYNKNDIFSTPKYKWTGPQDDLLISLMTACYWRMMFLLSAFPGYHDFKQLCALGGRRVRG